MGDKSSLIYGKIAPQAPELEEAILGAIILEPQALSIVVRFIQDPHCFYSDAHQRIFNAIKILHEKGSGIDFMTVCEQLRKTSELELVGGSYFVTNLTQNVVSSANIIEHTLIVVEKYIAREIIRISGDSIADSYEDGTDIFERLDKLQDEYADIQNKISSFKHVSFQKQIDTAIEKIETGTVRTEVSTGYDEWDRANGGNLFAGLYFVGGRPSMGKSSFLIETAIRQAKNRTNVGIWSGEMGSTQMITRMGSNMSEVPARKITDYDSLGMTDKTLFQQGMNGLLRLPIELDDEPRDINSLCNLFRYWITFKGVKAIWLDYIRLIKTPDKMYFRDDTAKINYFTEKLRELSKELGIPIFVLIQLNRQLENRSGEARKPRLSDLKNSGEVEESAFSVLFIDRPEKDNPDPMLQKDMIISIRKNREGSLCDISCIAELARYSITERPFTRLTLSSEMDFDDNELPTNKKFDKGLHTKTDNNNDENNENNEKGNLPF